MRPTLVLCLCALAACDSAHIAAPSHAIATPLSPIHRDLLTQTFSIPVPPTNDSGGGTLASVNTGINMPAWEMHYDSIAGTVSVGSNALYTCCNFPTPSPSAIGEVAGALGFAFTNDYYPNLEVVIGDYGSNPQLIALGTENTDPVQTDTFYNGSGGDITVARYGVDGGTAACIASGNDCECPAPCSAYSAGAYTFYSTEVLYVIPAPMPAFTITASPDTVTSGNSVQFTPHVTPSSFGSHLYHTDYGNATWIFNGVQSQCWIGCNMTPTASGWMIATAAVNGFTVTDSVYVVVH
jgi:hypothetical protein